jgi:CHAT domain-containing protein/Flp pilus assembly protein TadD
MKIVIGVIVFCFAGSVNIVHGQQWKLYADTAKSLRDRQLTDEAITYYSKAKAALPADSIVSTTSIQLDRSTGELFYSINEFDKARLVLENARKTAVSLSGPRSDDYAKICNILGATYNMLGELDTAKALHLQAKEIRKTLFGIKDPSYAQSCNNLGSLYRDLGQFDLAEPLILEAKQIRENIAPAKQAPVYATTCNTLANLYRDMGQYEKAEQLYIEACDIRSKLAPVNEHREYGYSCNILADLYYYMKQFEKAESLYIRATHIREKINKDSYEYGQTCNNLASLYRDMGQFEKAESLAMEAKSVWEKVLPEGHTSRTINTNNLGELYYAMGKYRESETFLLRSRQTWLKEKEKDHPYLIDNSDELARVYWAINEPEKVNELLLELSALKYKKLDKIFQFTNESEKQAYLKNINGSADQYQSFYYKAYDHGKAGPAYTIALLNRNLILSSLQQTRQLIHSSGNTALINQYNTWADLKQRLANLYFTGNETYAVRIAELEQKTDSIEKVLSRTSSLFRNQHTVPTWKNVQQSLRPGEAAIEFVQFNFFNKHEETDSVYYVALVMTKEMNEPRLVPLFEESRLREFLSRRTGSGLATISLYYSTDFLYRLTWEPLEEELKGISKVYFAPSGLLHRISFAALRTGVTGSLSDKYELTQLLTTAAITDSLAPGLSPSGKVVLYGDVQYSADTIGLKKETSRYGKESPVMSASLPEELVSRGDISFWRPLPGTKLEVESIRNEATKHGLGTLLYTGLKANEESVKALNADTSISVVHIATHGFFFPDPKKNSSYSKSTIGSVFKKSDNPLFRGGLVMAGGENTWKGKSIPGIDDGILTAYEVSNMYLPATKLVVLSACETGVGDIHGSEGVYGLQRAFKIAGVKYLLMSLWEVPDTETSEFMRYFYENLFNNQPVSDAFHAAQEKMRKKYSNEPYKWGAWILVR